MLTLYAIPEESQRLDQEVRKLCFGSRCRSVDGGKPAFSAAAQTLDRAIAD